MADVEKAVGRVGDQDDVVATLSDQVSEFMESIQEQGEDVRVLLEENAFLRAQIDRASRVAAAAATTRDKAKSEVRTCRA